MAIRFAQGIGLAQSRLYSGDALVTVMQRYLCGFNRFAAVAVATAIGLCAGANMVIAATQSSPIPSRYAAIIIEDSTGQVLHQVNPDAQRYPASLTKMMTLYMIFEAVEGKKLGLDQRIPISPRASGMAPSRLGLKPGETLTVRQAILGLVTKSANDAAAAVGEALGGGSEANFADMMTRRAHALGMTNTVFRNASGLPNPKQVTTARDMAVLARALRRDFPQHYEFFKTPDFTFKGITHRNHNRLLGGFDGTDGLKTGFIAASGFNLAASAVRDNRRIVGVVLGGESTSWRDARMMHLFDQAFDRTLPFGDTMMANATPPRKAPATKPATATASAAGKPKPSAARPSATAQAGTTASSEQGDGATKLAALPPNRPRPAAAKPTNGWAIQVGAFSSAEPAKDAAIKAKNKLPKTLKGSHVSVSPGADNLYRARLTGLTEQLAQSACKQLTNRSIACITIAPEAPAPAKTATTPAAG